MRTEPRVILVPRPIADVLDQLAELYATQHRENSACDRLIEIAVLQRGCAALQLELGEPDQSSSKDVA